MGVTETANPKEYIHWREEARRLLLEGVPPSETHWDQEQPRLFIPETQTRKVMKPKVTPEFLHLARYVSCARPADKWSLLYRLVYRLNFENPNLLKVATDDDVLVANRLYKSVRRDIHKMHAFVRFKRVDVEGQDTYAAWHGPEHPCLELGAPFFVRRFGDKPWTIFTPDLSAHWDLKELTYSEGKSQRDFEVTDPFDEVWTTYYKSIFNPARLKIKAMKNEMAPKYWQGLPEAAVIRELIRDTPRRLQNMASAPNYMAVPPATADLSELRAAASACAACPLAQHATQTVFGEGPVDARLMIVGEQPGDQEDLAGHAFVGPAGEILNQALAAAGVPRETVYVTNAVKHFKFTRTGKTRLHQKPNGGEMHACKPWLESEISIVKPKVILALGNTAATAVYGKLVKIQSERGHPFTESRLAETLMVSWHPAAILRSSTEEEKQRRLAELTADIKAAIEQTENEPH